MIPVVIVRLWDKGEVEVCSYGTALMLTGPGNYAVRLSIEEAIALADALHSVARLSTVKP